MKARQQCTAPAQRREAEEEEAEDEAEKNDEGEVLTKTTHGRHAKLMALVKEKRQEEEILTMSWNSRAYPVVILSQLLGGRSERLRQLSNQTLREPRAS